MIKINLLPYQEKRKKAGAQRQIIIMSAVLTVFMIGIMILQLSEKTAVTDLREKVKTAEVKLAALSKVAGEIGRVKTDKAILEKKIAIIKNLEANRLKPVLILDNLTDQIPAGQLWLTTLSITETECRIDGTAKDNQAVAQFMKNLEHSPYFKSVDLIASKQAMIGTHKLQTFTVSCGFKKGS